ncbi:DUF3303 domain-containing protein [Nocardioides mesophilus]|uniref:DUF3303 domain-containing protein n=1 Tax=Nocardioides mesophilus TaxID=433659 RepID=A0A7G9R7Q5_9ACTN|nr:DUF3303 family protein [Nocardioides mesophilus]QNN51630.1 hypothetical protein H9L09_13765 [Nocardioides mesophilus]
MKSLYMTTYRYREGLREDDLRDLTKRFLEVGTSEGVVSHYERLDGRGGYLITETDADSAKTYEVTLRYAPWMDFETVPITTLEDAFPVIQRVYG